MYIYVQTMRMPSQQSRLLGYNILKIYNTGWNNEPGPHVMRMFSVERAYLITKYYNILLRRLLLLMLQCIPCTLQRVRVFPTRNTT